MTQVTAHIRQMLESWQALKTAGEALVQEAAHLHQEGKALQEAAQYGLEQEVVSLDQLLTGLQDDASRAHAAMQTSGRAESVPFGFLYVSDGEPVLFEGSLIARPGGQIDFFYRGRAVALGKLPMSEDALATVILTAVSAVEEE